MKSMNVTKSNAVELKGDAFALVSGGYPCSYLGVEDWNQMMSYCSRNYSC